MSFEKARLLLREAEADLEAGCYNKCVSSAYFAARMVAETWLKVRGVKDLPRRDDKLANLLRNMKLRAIADGLMALYKLRKLADYSGVAASLEHAREALRLCRLVFEELACTT